MRDLQELPLSRPSIGEAEIEAVVRVLRSGWITTGARCADLERVFCELTGAPHAVALSSATAGMHLALHALDIGPGDEVITPSLTWVSTVNLISLRGATPVFVDVERDSLMVSRAAMEAAITPRTKLLVPVHFAGAALDLEGLYGLAEERGLGLIEDAAHALGTEYSGAHVGARGTSIFSLHPIKNATSIEGGVLCTDDAELAQRVRRLRFHGLGADAHDRRANGRAPQSEVLEPGLKYNLPDVNAALALAQLERLESFLSRRAHLAALYEQGLGALDGLQPLSCSPNTSRHAWHLYVVRVLPERCGIERDELMARLRERGIGTGIHFRAVHEQRYYREHPQRGADALPHTEWNSRRLLSLPLFPAMGEDDVQRVLDALAEVVA